MKYLELLLTFLRPGVGEPDPQPDPQPDSDPQPELDLDQANPDPEPQRDPKADLESARREAREAKEASERYQRELVELRTRQAPVQQNDEFAREERILADPNATEQAKWKVQADRVLRQNTATAQMTLAEARDVRDQTAFSQLALTEPAMHKRYAAKVEEELVAARRSGNYPTREAIYNHLIAKDMRAGAFKKKTPTQRTNDANLQPNVNRGKLPGARSDVTGKSGMSEREKRKERLRDQQI